MKNMINRSLKDAKWEEPEEYKCHGRCGVFEYCEGDIKGVNIYNKHKTRKWSSTYYCERAIKDTVNMGYSIEIVR